MDSDDDDESFDLATWSENHGRLLGKKDKNEKYIIWPFPCSIGPENQGDFFTSIKMPDIDHRTLKIWATNPILAELP